MTHPRGAVEEVNGPTLPSQLGTPHGFMPTPTAVVAKECLAVPVLPALATHCCEAVTTKHRQTLTKASPWPAPGSLTPTSDGLNTVRPRPFGPAGAPC